MNLTGKTIAITDADGPLPGAFAAAFGQHGATVERIQQNTDPAEFVTACPDIEALIYIPPVLPSGPTLELMQHAEPLNTLTAEIGRFMRLFQAVGGAMASRQHGCILIVGGLSGSTGWPGYAFPSALYGALLALTRSLACELATQNVRVLYLSHGAVEDYTPGAFAARAPAGKAATPDEIARVAVHLASDRASFMTGTEIRADGGWKAWGLLK